jgi:hypothetical protein
MCCKPNVVLASSENLFNVSRFLRTLACSYLVFCSYTLKLYFGAYHLLCLAILVKIQSGFPFDSFALLKFLQLTTLVFCNTVAWLV